MRKLTYILPVIALLAALPQSPTASAQRPLDWASLVRVRAGVASNGNLQPLWSYSNQWGTENMYDRGNATVYAKITGHAETKTLSLRHSALFGAHTRDTVTSLLGVRMGLALQASTDGDRTFVHEGYVAGNLWVLDFTLGLHAFTPIFSNNELSSGSYLMSDNSRPAPRVGAGLFRYWSLPFTWNLLQVRGSVFFAYKDNEGDSRYTDKFIQHEKCAYGRLGTPFAKPYIGLAHSSMMGGRLPDGTKIPVDFWNTFFARPGSTDKFADESMRGETTNAAGSHQGMWDLGVDIDVGRVAVTAYYQRPFADSKAEHLITKNYPDYGAEDYTLGVDVRLPMTRCGHVCLEFVRTVWQGSAATPDPVFADKDGNYHIVYPNDITGENWEEWKNLLDPPVVDGFEQYIGRKMENIVDLYDLFRKCFNRGLTYGGRSNYMSNSYYPQGWSKDDLCMGSAFFHTAATTYKYAPPGTVNSLSNMTLVRLWAVNVGASGQMSPRLTYRFRYAFTRNFGNRIDQYDGAYSWAPHKDYFFSPDGLREQYLMLEATFAAGENMRATAQLSADFGQMYNSAALKIGVEYKF